MLNKLIGCTGVLVILGIIMIPNTFAELDYSDLDIDSKDTILFEMADSNVIVVTIQLSNNSDEKFSSYGNYFFLVSSNKYYEEVSSYDVNIGNKTCPSLDDIPAGVSKEVILCYEIPKNLSNSSYTLEVSSGTKDWCDDISDNQYYDNCQITTKSIKSPKITNYDEYKKKFITKNTDIKIDFDSIDLIEQEGFNVLKIDFDVTNLSSDKIRYSSTNVFAITPDDISYSPGRYDLIDVGYERGICSNYNIDINPKLTKSYSYCFEVSQANTIFDLTIREGNFHNCDGSANCTEYVLNISNPNIVPLYQEPIPKSIPEPKLEIASFVDQSKDPQSYIDRYNNEPEYKKWFDRNYPDYTIYEAVGLQETQSESIIIPELTLENVGLKIGQSVKYNFVFDSSSSNEFVDALIDKTLITTYGDVDITKIKSIEIKITDISSSKVVIQKTVEIIDGSKTKITHEEFLNDLTLWSLFIPTNVNIGDKLLKHSNAVLESQSKTNKMYDGKMFAVWKTVLTDDTNDFGRLDYTGFYDQETGILLEKKFGVTIFHPSFGGSIITIKLEAVDVIIPYTEPKVDSEPIDDTNCGVGTIMKDGFCAVNTSKPIESKSSSKGGGCLIATATYGSELAPQVQQLRELRDNSLLNTQSGTSFMNTFNDIYYSFSPIIADYERENPIFKETVKIGLIPLISSLSILNYVEMDSEIEVLGYGISLILLNIGMYFVMPVVVIIGIRKQFLM